MNSPTMKLVVGATPHYAWKHQRHRTDYSAFFRPLLFTLLLAALATQGQTPVFDAAAYARRLDDKKTRREAAGDIDSCLDDDAVPRILAILHACKDPGARACMTGFLARQKGPAASAALALLLTDRDRRVRIMATESLAQKQDPRALSAVVNWFCDSSLEQARWPGLLLLGYKETGVGRLTSMIRDGDRETVRKALTVVHGGLLRFRKLGGNRGMGGSVWSKAGYALLGHTVVRECLPRLLQLAQSSDDKDLRRLAWETIAATPGKAGAEAVWKHLQATSNLDPKQVAVLLSLVRHPRRVSWLEQRLDSAGPESAGILALSLLEERRLRAIDAIVRAARRIGPPPADEKPDNGSCVPTRPSALGGTGGASLWNVLARITDPRVETLALEWARGQEKLPPSLVAILLVQRVPLPAVRKLLEPPYFALCRVPFQTTVIGGWGQKVVPILRAAAGPNSPPVVRRNAVYALTAAGGESVLPLLSLLAQADDPVDRRTAAACLDLYWDIRSVPILLRLAKDGDRTVRTEACSALTDFHEPETVPALIKLYRIPADAALCSNDKESILEALAPLETPGLRDFMLEALNQAIMHEPHLIDSVLKWHGWRRVPPPFDLLERGINGEKRVICKTLTPILAAYPPEQVVPMIARKLEDKEHRLAAVDCLSKMLPQPLAMRALLSAMHDGDRSISFVCAEGLITHGGDLGRSRVLAFLPESHWPVTNKKYLRSRAKEEAERPDPPDLMVRNLPVEKAKAILAGKLTDPDRDVRIRAACKLAALGDRRGEAGVIEAFHDSNLGFQWKVLEAVKALRTPALADAVLARLSQKPNFITILAVKELGDARALPDRLRLTAEGPPYGMESCTTQLWGPAIQAAARIGGEEVFSLVSSQLEQILTWRVASTPMGNGTPYFILIRAAGETHDPRFIPLLLRASYDPAVDPRIVAESLGDIGDPRGVDVLLDMARRPRAFPFAGCWNLPSTCGVALGKIAYRAPIVRPRITDLLTSTNWRLRQCAVQACGELGASAPRQFVLKALRDPQPDVRLAAADAAGRLGMARVKPTLTALAENSPYWYVRDAARDSLTRLAGGTPESWWW